MHCALKQIYPLKALGPDSMPPSFQHFWPTVGNLVTKTVLDFLNFGVIPPKFNETHIILVPKTSSLRELLSTNRLAYVTWYKKRPKKLLQIG